MRLPGLLEILELTNSLLKNEGIPAGQTDFPAEAEVEPHAIILEQTWRRSRLLLLVYVIATLVYVTYKPSRQTGEGKKFANAETGNEVLHH